MLNPPPEISRDDLLTFLKREGFAVSTHQLLRWHDAGLLPQPRRQGLGRGKGTASWYPRETVLQARALAALLQRKGKRSLDEAGWGLWVMGFPLTEWARDLLLDRLWWADHDARKSLRSLKAKDSKLKRSLANPRTAKRLGVVAELVHEEALPRMVRLMLELQTGPLTGEVEREGDWESARDIGLASHPQGPNLSVEPIPVDQFVRAMAGAAKSLSYRATIAAINKATDGQLEQFRNELQFLLELILPPDQRAGALIDTDDYVAFFKARYMAPGGAKEFAESMRSMGLDRAPGSPLQRWHAFHQRVSASRIPQP